MEQVKRGAVVYLDANVLIYLTEGTEDQRRSLHGRFARFEASAANFITSELAFTEVLVHPIRENNIELLHAYERLMCELVAAQPISREVLYLAAKLRAQTPSQRTPDAIHVATSILSGADIFLTGDMRIKNVPPPIVLERV